MEREGWAWRQGGTVLIVKLCLFCYGYLGRREHGPETTCLGRDNLTWSGRRDKPGERRKDLSLGAGGKELDGHQRTSQDAASPRVCVLQSRGRDSQQDHGTVCPAYLPTSGPLACGGGPFLWLPNSRAKVLMAQGMEEQRDRRSTYRHTLDIMSHPGKAEERAPSVQMSV